MKRIGKGIIMVILAAMMLNGCSNKGVHMPKHRKRTHCNCPTFAMMNTEDFTAVDDAGRQI